MLLEYGALILIIYVLLLGPIVAGVFSLWKKTNWKLGLVGIAIVLFNVVALIVMINKD